MTYRQREHCGPDFEPIGWRPKEEVDYFLKKDPVARLERFLVKEKLLTSSEKDKMKEDIKKEIDKAFDFALTSPFPKAEFDEAQVFKGAL